MSTEFALFKKEKDIENKNSLLMFGATIYHPNFHLRINLVNSNIK